MTNPKKSMVNMSLDFEFVKILKVQAEAHGFAKLSDYVQDWLKKLSLEKNDIKRVIMQIPSTAFENRQSLTTWLRNRSNEITEHYFKEKDVK